jgi:cell division protein ZapA
MGPGTSDKKPVRVTIYDQTYTLLVSSDAGEVEALAASIDELMSGIAARTGTSEASRVAVLACLHLADRLRALERELSSLKQRLSQKSEQYSLLLDQAIEDPKL